MDSALFCVSAYFAPSPPPSDSPCACPAVLESCPIQTQSRRQSAGQRQAARALQRVSRQPAGALESPCTSRARGPGARPSAVPRQARGARRRMGTPIFRCLVPVPGARSSEPAWLIGLSLHRPSLIRAASKLRRPPPAAWPQARTARAKKQVPAPVLEPVLMRRRIQTRGGALARPPPGTGAPALARVSVRFC